MGLSGIPLPLYPGQVSALPRARGKEAFWKVFLGVTNLKKLKKVGQLRAHEI